MKDVSEGGRTVLFVSHNMGAIAQLCQKCILLEKGRIVTFGDTQKVIDTYLSNLSNKTSSVIDLTNPTLRKNSLEDSLFKWTQAKIVNSKGVATSSVEFMEPFDLVITGVLEQEVEELHVAFDLKSGMGVLLFNSIIADTDLPQNYTPGTISFKIKFDPNLLGPGFYSIGISAKQQGIIDWIPEAITFNVEQASSQDNKSVRPTYDGLIVYPCKWSVHTNNITKG
jgi:lipopolysaccharide transport system ATP-binding protein